mgnify:CR=1 FL=1
MKKPILSLLLIALFLGSCMRNEYLVESDYSYAGSFKEYKTFDLLISFKMFYGDFNFHGYNQPDFESWLTYQNENERYDPVNYKMYEGTIIVILWDRKKRRVVWQGYATTMFGNPYQNEKYIKWAVRSIFDQYKIFGEEIAVQNRLN